MQWIWRCTRNFNMHVYIRHRAHFVLFKSFTYINLHRSICIFQSCRKQKPRLWTWNKRQIRHVWQRHDQQFHFRRGCILDLGSPSLSSGNQSTTTCFKDLMWPLHLKLTSSSPKLPDEGALRCWCGVEFVYSFMMGVKFVQSFKDHN